MTTFTGFDGVVLSSVNLDLGFPYGNDGAYTATPSLRQRTNQVPVQESISYGERQIPFIVIPLAGSGISDAVFRQRVYQYLAPAGGLRTLAATHDDGSTTLSVQADITELRKLTNRMFSGTFTVPDPIWRSTTAYTSTTNGGDFKSLPVVTITPTAGSSTLRRRITVADNTGRGLYNYPILVNYDSSAGDATAAADYAVFVNGRSVPFNVAGMDTATTKIWFRCDVAPSGTTNVDIYYGASINNSLANTYNAGGMDLANSSNTSWVWDTPYAISSAPNATGVWRPGKLGLSQDNTSFGISAESTSSLTLLVDDANGQANDADCMICVLGATATANLVGLTRGLNSTAQIGGIVSSFVKYRTPGQTSWTKTVLKAWDSTASAPPQTETPTSANISIAGAVEVAIGIEPTEGQPAGNLALSGTLTIALTNYPTVTIGGSNAARYISSGSLANSTSSTTITFTDLFCDNETLTIDCLNKYIVSAANPFYGSITFSNPDDWFALSPGANTITPTGCTATYSYSRRYLN
jgi:hypothetical protein